MNKLTVKTKSKKELLRAEEVLKANHLDYVLDKEESPIPRIYKLNEKSLAKDWNSEEDSRWDKII